VTTSVTTALTPVVTLATGIERNFGSIFVRAEAEMIFHVPNAALSSKIYYNPSANIAVGYRF
jgi:hypothetical protein